MLLTVPHTLNKCPALRGHAENEHLWSAGSLLGQYHMALGDNQKDEVSTAAFAPEKASGQGRPTATLPPPMRH